MTTLSSGTYLNKHTNKHTTVYVYYMLEPTNIMKHNNKKSQLSHLFIYLVNINTIDFITQILYFIYLYIYIYI